MTDEANAKHTKAAIEKLARVTSIILRASGVGLVFLLPLTILFGSLGSDGAFVICGLVCLAVFLLGLLAGVVRVSLSVFGESQMRLNEMLATVLVAGAVSVWPVKAINSGRDEPEPKIRGAVLGLLIFLMAGAGSAWGWSVCRRLGVSETWQRLKLLLYGWSAAAGVCSLVVFLCCGIVFLLSFSFDLTQDPMPAGFWIALAVSGPGSLLIIPAIRTELACRRKAKAEGNQQPVNQPPPA